MKLRRLLILMVVVLLSIAPVAGAGWEEVVRHPQQSEHVETEDVELATRDGYIYIATTHPVAVKVFTILGQAVAQTTLQPGSFRFKLPAKGIYILKIGSTTRRVTV